MTDDRSPQLTWTEDDAPRSGRFGDVYFSKEDGLSETRAVFLAGCGLPEAWAGRSRFTVAELGFGTGLNIAALLDLWRGHRPAGGRLHIVSVEGFPLSRNEAARALAAWPELAEPVAALLAAWPDPVPGLHRMDLPGFDATLDLAIGEVEDGLSSWGGRADAWFLDGFAPSTNPGMWSDAVMDLIAARSAPGARVATFTVAGGVRRALAERGFVVEKRPGHGRKRERLEARLPGEVIDPRPPRVAVVGAGIAGAALARAFDALGVRATVVEAAGAGAGASGFPAALVTPRLDAGDRGIAALYAFALERARTLYAATPGAVIQAGVLQLEQAPRDAGRHAKIAVQDVWSAGAMTVLDGEGCAERTDEKAGVGGLAMAGALAILPETVLGDWLGEAKRLEARVERVARTSEGWRLTDAAGEAIMDADVVVLTAGWGNAALWPDAPLAPVAGQADWVEGPSSAPVAWGGYAVPTGTGVLYGATHERGETEPVVSGEASARNLEALRTGLPALAGRVAEAGPGKARVAVRATTPDRLPLAGAIEAGLYVLGGLGSRGFCAAPLLAEHVAALAVGAPSPLRTDLADRVEPLRFATGPGLVKAGAKADGRPLG